MPYASSAACGNIGGASVPSGTNTSSCNNGGCMGANDSPTSSPEGLNTNGTSISVISSPNGLSPDLTSPPSTTPSSRPPLPPPPRQPHCVHGRPWSGPAIIRNQIVSTPNENTNDLDQGRPWWRSWNRKYVLLCGTCGLSSILLGTFYLIIYFILRSYTSSLEFFQTMPTYIPACALIVTGLLVLCFMKRKNRLSILIKIVGFLCLVCAVLCVVVTVTTTVLHMNRLQTLRECTFYTQLHSCTCLPFTDEEPFELKLDIHITTCDVIHGPLYSCLRAMFGVSVIGILVSIFSCMLVYQLLSHEKKKMYWEQLENRRRMLFRRAPAPVSNCNNCCDEYGFVPSSELYPWGGMWDPVDERYWTGGAQLYSPGVGGEDSSNASRSVLLGGANPNGTPSLWLPWGGAWGAAGVHPAHSQGVHREPSTPAESAAAQADQENLQNEEMRPHSTGVLLRPFLPRGIEARFGLRRQPPPPPGSHSRRPLSDPGVALQLPRYPPPFSEGFLPPLPYEGLEAFSRLMWDPPPPYSQPASAENLTVLNNSATSPMHDVHRPFNVISTPQRRPTTLADLIRGPTNSSSIPSPNDIAEMSANHAHFTITKCDDSGIVGDPGSLPLNHRLRRLPLGHVKSLDDVTESTRESLEVLFCDGNEITSLDKFQFHGDVLQKFPSHGDITPRLFTLKSRHLKSMSDPKGVYVKGEQESELYFADVSSCVSLRADAEDGDETLYYSEPASQKNSPEHGNSSDATGIGHLYEQVRHHEDEEEDDASHHTSDDTMIVHTSSSDHSLGVDTENTYSVVSPLTDQSSASPMVTDTDAYSCYQVLTSPSFPKHQAEATGNLNLHSHRQLQMVQPHHHHSQLSNHQHMIFNDNDHVTDEEPRYEMIQGEETTIHLQSEFVTPSDMNGNVALSAAQRETPDIRQAQRMNLSLPLRRLLPSSSNADEDDQNPPEGEKRALPPRVGRRHASGKPRKKEFQERSATPFHNHNSEPNTPTDRRLQSVQDHLFTLKSVNV